MKNFLGKRLLFVTAHPDDESYAVAGTIMRNYKAGGQSFLICATLGEKGKSHLKKKVTNAALKKIRKDELVKVQQLLKIHSVKLLGLSDTKLKDQQVQLYKKVRQAVSKTPCDYILSFGPDGLTGHQDHIAIGAVATKVAREFKIPFVSFHTPPSYYKHQNLINRRRRFGVYTKKQVIPKTNLKIKIDPHLKRRAIGLHKSQFTKDPFALIPKEVVKDLLNYEYFTVQ